MAYSRSCLLVSIIIHDEIFRGEISRCLLLEVKKKTHELNSEYKRTKESKMTQY